MEMRRSTILHLLIYSCLALSQAHAQDLFPSGGYYFGMLGGWTSLSSQQSKIFVPGLAPISNIRESYDHGDWNFGEHLLAGVRAGYEWGPWRFEEEYSYRHEWMFRFADAPAGHTGDSFKGARDSHAFLTNVIYEVPVSWPVRPHFGIGIGAVKIRDSVSASQPFSPVPGFTFPAGEILLGQTWQPGIQGIAGIRYDITPTLALDIEYRYLKTPNFTLQNRAIPEIKYRTGYDTHHSVLSLVFKFAPPTVLQAAAVKPPPPAP
jgi:opacity protein-like surface antigen